MNLIYILYKATRNIVNNLKTPLLKQGTDNEKLHRNKTHNSKQKLELLEHTNDEDRPLYLLHENHKFRKLELWIGYCQTFMT